MMLALALLLTTPPARQPDFSWERLPRFWHAGNMSGPLNNTLVGFVAHKGWSMATIEKMQAQGARPEGQHAEAKIIAAAQQLKAASPTLPVIFYLNSVMDWPQYDLHVDLTKSPALWLTDDLGQPIVIHKPGCVPANSSSCSVHVFDHAQAQMRALFLGVLQRAKASGAIDGCFLDRGNTNATAGAGGAHGWKLSAARKVAWDAGHMEVLQSAGQLFSDGVVLGNNADFPGVNGRMIESFGNDFQHGWGALLDDIALLQREARMGTFLEVHGESRKGLGLPLSPIPKTSSKACTPDVFNITLAGFLVGAGERAYYACTTGWTAQAGWDEWHHEYDLPLGAPAAPATHEVIVDSTVVAAADVVEADVAVGLQRLPLHFFRRSFQHARVELNVTGEGANTSVAACVCWNSGWITGEDRPCQAVCAGTMPPAEQQRLLPNAPLKSDDSNDTDDSRGRVSIAESSGPTLSSGSEECVITDAPFHAIADNTTVNTAAIQRAIDACHATHPAGSRVIIPAGAFKTGAILLRSNMELHLAKGAGLYGSSDPRDYPLLKRALPFGGHTMWQALVSGFNLSNVSITGENAEVPGSDSIIDGVGWWWNCLCRSVVEQLCIPNFPNRAAAPYCKAFNPTNLTVEAVTTACGGPAGGKAALRPKLIEFFNCTGVKLSDFTAQNAMCWTIHPTYSTDVIIQRLTVLGAREIGGVSGIEHDSCVNCLVEDTHVDIGDDGITVKSNNFSHWGVTGLTSSRNITVRRCTVLSRNICLGASTSGGISGVAFEDLVLGEQNRSTLPWAIKFKISTGFIENVAFRRISIGPVGDTPWMYPDAKWSALMIDFDDTRPTNATPPHLWARGVLFEDISAVSEKAPSHISGPDTCLEGLTLRNVTLGGSKRWLGCHNVDLSSLTVDSVSPPLSCTGCK
jgi:hypothetical protein